MSEKSPRVSASASLMRAPVFHSVCQQHLAAQIRDVMEQGVHFRGQQVFGQFIMNHRHLAECQRCRIIDGNRKLSGIPGMVGIGAGRCCISVFTPRGTVINVWAGFHNPVLSRITELVTATRPDGDNKTPSLVVFGEQAIALLTQHVDHERAHRCRLQISVPAHHGHAAFVPY